MEKLERVARRICRADGCNPDAEIVPSQVAGDREFTGALWRHYLPHAQAAIDELEND